MDHTVRNHFPFMALVFAAFVSSCSGAQKKNETVMTSEEFEKNSPAADDPCVGPKGAPLECANQSDCCKGYACSKDPERNARSLYCIKE